MSKAEVAVARFEKGYACSQAILSVYGEDFGLDHASAMRIAEGFVGGIACLGHTCGAVVGAVMVIGLKYGRTDVRDRKARAKTIRAVREFMDKFEARHGTTGCRELIGCEIDTPEKEKKAERRGLFSTICPGAVRDAALILEEMLEIG